MTTQFSEEFLRKRKRMLITTMGMMLLGVMAIVLLKTGLHAFIDSWGIWVGVTIYMLVIMLITSYFTFKKMKQLKVTLEGDKLTRDSGKHHEVYSLREMTRVQRIEKPNGFFAIARLEFPGRKLTLFGLNDMDQVYEMVLAQKGPQTTLVTKKQKLDWENPFIMLAMFVVGLAGYELLTHGFSSGIVSPLFQILFGSYFVSFKPLSNAQGPRFRIFEWIVGGLLVVFGVFGFVMKLG